MPKTSTFRPYNFTAQIWNFTVTTNQGDASNTATYFYLRDTKVHATQGLFGKLTLTLPDDASDVMVGAQLRKLKDKGGLEITPGGIWTLAGLVPIVSVFGKREGYTSQATLTYVTAAAGS